MLEIIVSRHSDTVAALTARVYVCIRVISGYLSLVAYIFSNSQYIYVISQMCRYEKK